MTPVTVVILTRNEEANLPACLESLAGFDDVHVLDSGSTDGTLEIARAHGVSVHYNPFTGFGTQRNWAIDCIPARYDWQLHLDADERMTPALAAEAVKAISVDGGLAGFRIPSKMIFAGRWLKHAGQYPAYQVRLFHRLRLRFINHGHGQREVADAPLGTLREPIVHHAFSKGLDDWFRKHVGYARKEAEQALHGAASPFSFRDSTARRRALKQLTARLPCRYFLRLVYMLVVRRAVLDGWAGVTYAKMIATYEGMIDVYMGLLSRGIDPDTFFPGSGPDAA